MHRVVRASVLALTGVFIARAAFAVVAPSDTRGEVRLPGVTAVRAENPARQQALDASPAWQAFRARHGEWSAMWNEASATPHRAMGRGIALDGFRGDPASVDHGVRRFVAANPELFGGAPTLRAVSVRHHGNTWYASYRQTLDGLEVLFSDWEFRVHDSGRLTMFGADAAPTATVPSRRGRIVGAAARAAARNGVAFDAARDRVEGADRLFVLPYPTESSVEYRTVYEAQVVTTDPPAHWLTYVDAASGEVLLRINRVRNAISGTVTGTVNPLLPTDPVQARPLPYAVVTVGGVPVFTNASGFYTSNAAGTVAVSAELRGSFADVNRIDAADASFSTSATNPSTLNIAWGTAGISHLAERDAYYNVNLAHDHAKLIDPSFTGLDFPLPVYVNFPNTCNALWSPAGALYLYSAGDGCVNTATTRDVVFHEYGHGVNDMIYMGAGLPNGMINGSLHEGTADTFAALLEDDPIVGQGFFGIGTFVRNVDNTNRWPEDNGGEVHNNGLIIAGAFWDLRQAVGLAVARQLSFEAKHGFPDDLFDLNAFREMFVEVLVADDDNGNLADGTPHSAAILAAFNAHGIGTNASLFVNHTPVPDHTGKTTADVQAGFGYNGPSFTAFDPASPVLHYRVNRGVWQTAPMPPTGTPGQFRGTMATPNASVVEYYLSGADLAGGAIVSPAGAPNKNLYRFIHGPQTTLLSRNMETDPGWTIGDPSDLAISGIWVRTDPMGESTDDEFNRVPIQPADDHTVAGTQCFVTANGDSTQGLPGLGDVDAGGTTLITSTFSALAGGIEHPVVEYYRWYSNNAGNAPGEDSWVVDISNNGGGSWTNVENTSATDPAWQRVVFRIEDYVAPTASMKLRFIASDFGDGSLVEAGIDDFRLLGFVTGAADVGDPASRRTLALAVPYPNPSGRVQTLRFSLPEPARATLRIYDVTGRVRATLADGELSAGDHTATWNGAEGGHAVPAGMYFARLTVGDRELVQRVMRLN